MSDFSDIIGNEATVRSLRAALANGRAVQSAAFCGERGSGKKTLARAYAGALLCEAGLPAACGVCGSCRAFESGNHPDFMAVSSGGAKSVGVGDVRRAVAEVSLRPLKAGRKVYIFEDAQIMTAAAQNALLKVLEQPPPFAVFILLSDSVSALLPTVRSRCIIYKTQPVGEAMVKKRLIETGVPAGAASLAAAYARGNIGRAAELARDAAFQEMRSQIPLLLAGLKDRGPADAFALAKRFEAWKDRAPEALSIALMWYRDALAYKECGGRFVIAADMLDLLEAHAGPLDAAGLLAQLGAVERAEARLRTNANFQLTLEVMFLDLILL